MMTVVIWKLLNRCLRLTKKNTINITNLIKLKAKMWIKTLTWKTAVPHHFISKNLSIRDTMIKARGARDLLNRGIWNQLVKMNQLQKPWIDRKSLMRHKKWFIPIKNYIKSIHYRKRNIKNIILKNTKRSIKPNMILKSKCHHKHNRNQRNHYQNRHQRHHYLNRHQRHKKLNNRNNKSKFKKKTRWLGPLSPKMRNQRRNRVRLSLKKRSLKSQKRLLKSQKRSLKSQKWLLKSQKSRLLYDNNRL